MPADPTTMSPARRRTHGAIVEAAIATWVRNRDATLDDVARAADTHRATLHRHFSSRADLLDAAVARCIDDIVAATEEADVARGEPLEALRRVVAGYLAVGDRIRFLFEDLRVAQHPAVVELDRTEGPVTGLIRRAQGAGAVDAALPPAWVERAVWALVFAASEAVDDGVLPAPDALGALVATIEGGITTARTLDSRQL